MKIITLQEVGVLAKKLKADGKTIVLAGGCFDVLHNGHRYFLTEAKKHGEALFVALESDENVRRLKGEGRPINKRYVRAKKLAGLKSIDYVVILPTATGDAFYFDLVKEIRPEVIVVTVGDPQLANKRKQARSVGGRIKVLPKLKNYSTTKILKK